MLLGLASPRDSFRLFSWVSCHIELILFSMADNVRSIPSLVRCH